ncbi:uncharacterized protein [Dysidea avara]|uniref:uncharacterized protein n=1 Tax=Dysidea avara TaxID=196820 RepID=UPI00331E0F45
MWKHPPGVPLLGVIQEHPSGVPLVGVIQEHPSRVPLFGVIQEYPSASFNVSGIAVFISTAKFWAAFKSMATIQVVPVFYHQTGLMQVVTDLLEDGQYSDNETPWNDY